MNKLTESMDAKGHRKTSRGLFAATLLALSAIVAPTGANATAITGTGGQIFATGGNVVVDILASDSGFSNSINFFYAYPDLSNMTFIGIDNAVATVDLGGLGHTFTLGQELVFGIQSGGNTFVMGPGSRNPDGVVHASVSSDVLGIGFVESWRVGFEDLFGGGDNDFNDAIIRVNQAAAVPLPATLGLLAFGLLGMSATRKPKLMI